MTEVLMTLPALARRLGVPEVLLGDLEAVRPTSRHEEALFDLAEARWYLRDRQLRPGQNDAGRHGMTEPEAQAADGPDIAASVSGAPTRRSDGRSEVARAGAGNPAAQPHRIGTNGRLLPLPALSRELGVPLFMLRDLRPSKIAASDGAPLYDVVAAKAHLRGQGVIFVDGEAVLIR